jgi:proteasome lid subunit RPN8/RPN11
VIASSDLVNALNEYVERSGEHPANLPMDHFIVWHTHPSGNIGPSKGDMDTKIEGFQYLVVTMPSGEATLF